MISWTSCSSETAPMHFQLTFWEFVLKLAAQRRSVGLLIVNSSSSSVSWVATYGRIKHSTTREDESSWMALSYKHVVTTNAKQGDLVWGETGTVTLSANAVQYSTREFQYSSHSMSVGNDPELQIWVHMHIPVADHRSPFCLPQSLAALSVWIGFFMPKPWINCKSYLKFFHYPYLGKTVNNFNVRSRIFLWQKHCKNFMSVPVEKT